MNLNSAAEANNELRIKLRQAEERTEKAEAEVERIKNVTKTCDELWRARWINERSLADQLAEALQATECWYPPHCTVGRCSRCTSLVAYKEARK